MNSDSEDEEILSDIELTAEELAEAEASLAAKHAKSKSTGDIVVPIDVTAETKKSKKYFDPSEFGIELIHGELGESLIDFEKPRISNKNAIAEAMSKIDISGDFLKQHHLRYAMTDYAKQKEKNAIKEKTTGKKWFDMSKPEITEDIKNDLQMLKYRSVLDNKTFMKGSDRRGHKYFQIGTIMDSAEDFYSSRLTKKQRGKGLVDELMADVEFRQLQRKRQAKMNAKSQENRGNPLKRKKKNK